MTRRAAKVTILPSQGLCAKLAKAVLPHLEETQHQPAPARRRARGQVVTLQAKPPVIHA